jgi:hypothetical protein
VLAYATVGVQDFLSARGSDLDQRGLWNNRSQAGSCVKGAGKVEWQTKQRIRDAGTG